MVTETKSPAKPQVLRADRVLLIAGKDFVVESDRMSRTPDGVTWFRGKQEVAHVRTVHLIAIVKL